MTTETTLKNSVIIKTGNIFTSHCQTLVNTVNCVGFMGAGIALEFKLRLPAMFEQYAEHCKRKRIDIGKLWLYKPPPEAREQRWVLNFPTKLHWKYPSKIKYLEAGLEKFVDTYQAQGIESIAFPILGSSNGGLNEALCLDLMRQYLGRCDIPVEIYRYDPDAADDLFYAFKEKILDSGGHRTISETSGIQERYVTMLKNVLENEPAIKSLSQLASVKGIGAKTIEKCFRLVMGSGERQARMSI